MLGPPGGPRWRGFAYALAMVVLFGLYTPAAKAWLGGISPLVATALLYLSAGTALALVQGLRLIASRRPAEPRLRASDLPVLLLGVAFGCLASPLLLFGLGRVSGTVGSLLGNLEGVFTLGIALLMGDSLKRLEGIGAAAILAGGVALSFQAADGQTTRLLGIVAVAGSCLAWAIDNMTTQRLSGRDPLALMATKGLLAGTASLGVALATGAALPAAEGLIALIGIGGGWACSMVCFVLAMRHLGAARVGSLLALSPFVGAVGSIVGLGERPTSAVLVAGALMAAGACCLAREHLRRDARLEGTLGADGYAAEG